LDDGSDIALTPDATRRVKITQGAFKLPSYANVAAITFSPAAGDMVFNIADAEPMQYSGAAWLLFSGGAAT